MDNPNYVFKTVDQPSEVRQYKEKKSKFYGYVFPIKTDVQVKTYLEQLRKIHPKANHICYAWRLGFDEAHIRTFDDGEPRNTAGAPILGQLNALGLTNVLVAVVRIFGGTKLGKGGLILAYRTTSRMALDASNIVIREHEDQYRITIGYREFDQLMRVIKQQKWHLIAQKTGTKCELTLSVRKSDAGLLRSQMEGMAGAQIAVLI